MKLFRADPESGLRKAQAALTAAQQKIAELEQERQLVLAEADTVEPVAEIDRRIAEQRQAAATHTDRVAVLRAAVREQDRTRRELARQAAIAEIEKRLQKQVELAKEVEAGVRHLGDKWNELLQWRTSILSAWPEGLSRPLATDFYDVGPLRRELGHALFAAGKPAWDRLPSIPPPLAPVPVEGLSPKGISGYVAAAGAAFIARVKNTRIESDSDEEAA